MERAEGSEHCTGDILRRYLSATNLLAPAGKKKEHQGVNDTLLLARRSMLLKVTESFIKGSTCGIILISIKGGRGSHPETFVVFRFNGGMTRSSGRNKMFKRPGSLLADAVPTPPPVEASYENQGRLEMASLQESRVRMSIYKECQGMKVNGCSKN